MRAVAKNPQPAVIMFYSGEVKSLIWLPKWLDSSRLAERVLTQDPVQRALIGYSLICTVNCLAGLVALNYGVALGLVDAAQASLLTWAGVIVTLCYYLIVRAGWNKRLQDPTMTEPQTMLVCAFIAWGYAIGGPGRASALPLLFIIMLFCMFACNPAQVMRVSISAAACMGAAMLVVATQEGGPPHVANMQFVLFALLSLTLATFSFLAAQVARVRAQNREQGENLKKAMARIQELAIRDDLTNLFNRRYMLETAQTELNRLDRDGGRSCFCIIDLDHFKHVNDRFGHGVGDDVLRAFALALQRAVREVDVVARWGGEEFLVMLPGASSEAAASVIERARREFADSVLSEKVRGLHVTFSAGLASRLPTEELSSVLDRADQALYSAKRAGRNGSVQAN
jgi:diguanylate cyclase (GGDEF)-like protein